MSGSQSHLGGHTVYKYKSEERVNAVCTQEGAMDEIDVTSG